MQPASSGYGALEAPIFKLPAELRNAIYKEVLGDLSNAFSCFGGVTYVQHQPCSISILFVNRQMYQDTHLLPYSMNSITAGPRTRFREWMGRRLRDQLRAVSRLHFVFDDFDGYRPQGSPQTVPDFGYSAANNFAVDSLLHQQLSFPELTGLKHILLELRSRAEKNYELAEQMEFLLEAKLETERLNPKAGVSVDLMCLGAELNLADIPASPMTGFRIMRFDKPVEGGLCIRDYLDHKTERRQNLRTVLQNATSALDREDV